MPKTFKILIGLAAVLLMGWVWHAPMHRGDGFVRAIEGQARAAVRAEGLPGVDVRLGRAPLSRNATLSGPADDFQRHGMGSEMGLSGRVAEVDGVGGVRWADE